jgi:hypothetical protein
MMILPTKDKETGEPFVSYSQLSTFEESLRNYIRRYFFKEKFLGNSYTEKGNDVGEALEHNDFSKFDEDEQKTLMTVPRYDDFERKIKLWFGDEYYVVGYIDTSTKNCKAIADYKTGIIESVRPKYDSDKYIQLDIYAAAIEQELGYLPDEVDVFIIERTGNGFKREELKIGDRWEKVEKKVTPERVIEVKEKIEKIVKQISEYYQVFLKLL